MMEFNIYSVIVSVFVGASAGYVGSLMVLKKMALVGDALSHVALPGLALGLLFNFDPFIGAFSFLFVSAILTWWLERNTELSFEAIVGTLFTLSLAIGILLVPEPDILEALFGDISQVNQFDAFMAVVISSVTIFIVRSIYYKMVLGIISEDLATSYGINVARINLLYILLVSMVVAVGIKIVGTLLVGALVIVPAAAIKNSARNMREYFIWSSMVGAVCSSFGVLVSQVTGFSAGPLVVISGCLVFLFSLIRERVLLSYTFSETAI